VKGDDPLPESTGPIGALRNDDVQLVGEREYTAIEELVVQGAENEPVKFLVRPAGSCPDRGVKVIHTASPQSGT
jgi:hypothetical protein